MGDLQTLIRIRYSDLQLFRADQRSCLRVQRRFASFACERLCTYAEVSTAECTEIISEYIFSNCSHCYTKFYGDIGLLDQEKPQLAILDCPPDCRLGFILSQSPLRRLTLQNASPTNFSTGNTNI
jgi:hypothetical protein